MENITKFEKHLEPRTTILAKKYSQKLALKLWLIIPFHWIGMRPFGVQEYCKFGK